MDAIIEILEYNPSWPGLLQKEKTFLKEIASDWLHGEIEHVGSTSVLGLAEKPIKTLKQFAI